MYHLVRTDSTNEDFVSLVKELDKDLAIRNGDNNDFFVQFNGITVIKHVVLCYSNGQAVGCGAIKRYSDDDMEVKRMYVLPDFRGKRIAFSILQELTNWAKELGFTKCILETGDKMPEAILLYNKAAFTMIKNYPPYEHVKSSICFEKIL